MNAAFILTMAMISCTLCAEPETPQYTYPDPLRPDAFEIMFDSRFPVPLILEACRYWDTEILCHHFKFLRDKIHDNRVDVETKKYAKSILIEATNRLKTALKDAQLEMDDKYDAYDFAMELRNIENGYPPVHKDLYRTIEKYFWPNEE